MMASKATTAMIEKAETLVAQAHTWNRGRSKQDGSGFFIIPSSDDQSAHWTSVFGCTCQSYRHRGACSHHEAVRLLQRQADRDRLAAAYNRLYRISEED